MRSAPDLCQKRIRHFRSRSLAVSQPIGFFRLEGIQHTQLSVTVEARFDLTLSSPSGSRRLTLGMAVQRIKLRLVTMELFRDRIWKARHRFLLRDSCLLTGKASLRGCELRGLGRLCTDWGDLATNRVRSQTCCRVEPLARQRGFTRQQELPVVSSIVVRSQAGSQSGRNLLADLPTG